MPTLFIHFGLTIGDPSLGISFLRLAKKLVGGYANNLKQLQTIYNSTCVFFGEIQSVGVGAGKQEEDADSESQKLCFANCGSQAIYSEWRLVVFGALSPRDHVLLVHGFLARFCLY